MSPRIETMPHAPSHEGAHGSARVASLVNWSDNQRGADQLGRADRTSPGRDPDAHTEQGLREKDQCEKQCLVCVDAPEQGQRRQYRACTCHPGDATQQGARRGAARRRVHLATCSGHAERRMCRCHSACARSPSPTVVTG